jgi:hypothetical protein
MKSWVDISIPGRHAAQYRLDDDGTTVGSGPAADIRLQGAPGLLGVHCSLRPRPEGCWVELIESAPEPFQYDGRPAREGMIAWGHDVYLGSTRLTVHADLTGARKGPSALLWVAALLLPLALLSFFFKSDGAASSRGALLEPPPMFGELPACSEGKEGALGRASVAEHVAHTKHERGVFMLDDAVEGVHLMREAAVCYALGDNQGSSDRALDEAEEWIADLKYTYKRAQLDLEFGQRDPSMAIDAIERLNVLLGHAGPQAEEYKGWLAQVRRDQFAAAAEQAAAEAKKK